MQVGTDHKAGTACVMDTYRARTTTDDFNIPVWVRVRLDAVLIAKCLLANLSANQLDAAYNKTGQNSPRLFAQLLAIPGPPLLSLCSGYCGGKEDTRSASREVHDVLDICPPPPPDDLHPGHEYAGRAVSVSRLPNHHTHLGCADWTRHRHGGGTQVLYACPAAVR
ncbi:hypothetical protein CONLIGDRAFT_686795 [Coniochaeta ligniaria NRRL 30616]|uniref:Uncharacterized protein n=1 Tax=Coniochaeta ligniaria NRRL 30616 TaxID=1408157 RepID=A0A1J7J0F5_9PEZI|nr:hypothetical protein CONLIGDRAFT_686795 [Coniochaeta ligniaria NRRL 30616]